MAVDNWRLVMLTQSRTPSSAASRTSPPRDALLMSAMAPQMAGGK
jgi:hypothetical protein